MTSASELFYNRRSRTTRRSSYDLGFLSPPLPSPPSHSQSGFNFSCNHRRHRNHRNCSYQQSHMNQHRQSSRGSGEYDGLGDFYETINLHFDRHRHRRVLSHTGRETRFDESHPLPIESTSRNLDASTDLNSSNLSMARNGRLPGSVLQARARLVERLRGASLSANRNRNPDSDDIMNYHHSMTPDDLRSVYAEDWETEGLGDWVVFPQTATDLMRFAPAPVENKLKPPGLSREVFNSLEKDVFRIRGEGESEMQIQMEECSICLERFKDGETLVCLPCRHGFHPGCLEPWITKCGDCPNCRANVLVNSEQ